ncbi:MAG: ATP-binding cassette domain-containing protein, partial [Deltaproteobacteria bacterium]|nr:ATP-binding cassette domain-containing protein [Deltaproteobacteria bacterium]
QGQVTGSMDTPFETSSLLRMMFGTPPEPPGRIGVEPGETILLMDSVSAPGGRTGLADCSIEVRQGEVIGLAGLEGSGQDVFLRIASGLIQPFNGSVEILGNVMNHKDYHVHNDAGVAFMPASRLEEGLIPGLSITEHFALQQKQGGFLVRWSEAFKKAQSRIDTFNVIGRPQSVVESLSGGNQQRLLLSFLPHNPVLLLLENPTRGLDMESMRWVWDHLHTYCTKKTSIIFSSSELDEIVMVADRVLVFYEGRVIKDVRTEETSSLELGRAIAGRVQDSV